MADTTKAGPQYPTGNVNARALCKCKTAPMHYVGHPYSPQQEAADLQTLDRIEAGELDYFDGMGMIAARRLRP